MKYPISLIAALALVPLAQAQSKWTPPTPEQVAQHQIARYTTLLSLTSAQVETATAAFSAAASTEQTLRGNDVQIGGFVDRPQAQKSGPQFVGIARDRDGRLVYRRVFGRPRGDARDHRAQRCGERPDQRRSAAASRGRFRRCERVEVPFELHGPWRSAPPKRKPPLGDRRPSGAVFDCFKDQR